MVIFTASLILIAGLKKEQITSKAMEDQRNERLEADEKKFQVMNELKEMQQDFFMVSQENKNLLDEIVLPLKKILNMKNEGDKRESLKLIEPQLSKILETASNDFEEATPPPDDEEEGTDISKKVSAAIRFGPGERFYSSSILDEEVTKVIKAYAAIPPDEKLIGFLKDSRKWKYGIAFTDKSIHFSDSIKGSYHLTYQEFGKASLKIKFISIYVNGEKVMGTGYTSDFRKTLTAVHSAVQPN